jgi:hypothetical protein
VLLVLPFIIFIFIIINCLNQIYFYIYKINDFNGGTK